MEDPWNWLADGWRDMKRAPLWSLSYGLAFVLGGELQLDEAADPCVPQGEAEVPQTARHGLPLGVEDPGLGPDEHGRLHPRTVSGSAR